MKMKNKKGDIVFPSLREARKWVFPTPLRADFLQSFCPFLVIAFGAVLKVHGSTEGLD